MQNWVDIGLNPMVKFRDKKEHPSLCIVWVSCTSIRRQSHSDVTHKNQFLRYEQKWYLFSRSLFSQVVFSQVLYLTTCAFIIWQRDVTRVKPLCEILRFNVFQYAADVSQYLTPGPTKDLMTWLKLGNALLSLRLSYHRNAAK